VRSWPDLFRVDLALRYRAGRPVGDRSRQVDTSAIVCRDPVEGETSIGPIEVAEQTLVSEDQILPACLEAEALDSGKVANEHVARSNPKGTG
jgi:hypothetical protein